MMLSPLHDTQCSRREFALAIAGIGAAILPVLRAATPRNLKIGHTCITWGTFPRGAEADATLEPAVRDIAALGFNGFETFPEVLEDWDAKDALRPLMDRYKLPLTSGYIRINVTDPTKAKESLDTVIRLGKVIRKYGGSFGVIQVNGVKRDSYNFKEYRAAIVTGLNDSAMALNDLGLGAGLHQHTGTAIETHDEVYTVMGEAKTEHLKFAPDVGQLQKGGSNAAQVIKDFLPLVKHMHLKDYKGWQHYAGYCPLGMGQVDITGVLNSLEEAHQQANIMVELDPSSNAPMSPLETAQTSKAYLEKLGYRFRT
ncbi:MAG TPA: sugar phosphate isomerase/epimerase [Bryobacteraceae bacterium]|nr:sugar phosphate isomerase/epimerase [Bryobacteraceae bacterium]